MEMPFNNLAEVYNALKKHLDSPVDYYTYICPRCNKKVNTRFPNFSVRNCEMICVTCSNKEYTFAMKLALNESDKLYYRYMKYKETGDMKWLEME